MQSKDYVPGVSGFKVDLKTGQVEINEGNVRVKAAASMITFAGPGQSDDKAAKTIREDSGDHRGVALAPFVVEAGRFFINCGQIDDAAISSKLATNFSVRLSLAENGQSYVAGFGLADDDKRAAAAKSELTARVTSEKTEPDSEFEMALAQGADAVLDYLAKKISETQLGQSLKEHADPIADRIRKVIREELRPGGLLHRSNR